MMLHGKNEKLRSSILVLIHVFFKYLQNFSRESYNAITNWLSDVRTLASPNIVIILCGNKKDLEDERQVTYLEASRFAQEHGNQIYFSKNVNFF
jgi:GTPase SAR1 family protein